VAALSVSAAFGVALQVVVLRRVRVPIWRKILRPGPTEDRGVIVHYALPAFLAGSVVAPAMWYARSQLAGTTDGYDQLGLFAAASQWSALVSFVPGIVASTMLPFLSQELARGTRRGVSLFWKNAALASGVGVVAAVGITALSPVIMVFYGKGFAEGGLVLRILLLSAAFDAANHALGLSLSTRREAWWTLAANLTWAGSLALGATLLVRRGAVGLAWAWVGAYGFQTVQLLAFSLLSMRPKLAARER
jgi:O-antigen/teichoic acid export membrane protein